MLPSRRTLGPSQAVSLAALAACFSSSAFSFGCFAAGHPRILSTVRLTQFYQPPTHTPSTHSSTALQRGLMWSISSTYRSHLIPSITKGYWPPGRHTGPGVGPCHGALDGPAKQFGAADGRECRDVYRTCAGGLDATQSGIGTSACCTSSSDLQRRPHHRTYRAENRPRAATGGPRR